MSTSFNLSKPNRTIHAGVILLDSETELLDVAPFHLMGSLSRRVHEAPSATYPAELLSQRLDIKCHWVNETGQPSCLTTGLRILPTDTFATCPPLDIILMGASRMEYNLSESEKQFITKAYNNCQAFLTVCGSYQALLHSGLLDGKTAAAPLGFIPELREKHPEVNWVAKRWHKDGKIWTTGTLINGLDAMRAFAEETWGQEGPLVGRLMKSGAWPDREVDLKDPQGVS